MTEEVKPNEKKGFLQEAPGQMSYMRVMSFIAFIFSLWMAYLEVPVVAAGHKPYLTLAFLIAAFAPKAIQKFAENLANK